MKSNKAIGLLDSRRRFNEQGTEYHYDDVLDIVELAEAFKQGKINLK